jgi:hypothetical protein
MTFHQLLNKPALAHNPATNPMKKATGHQGRALGSMATPQMILERVPVSAPAQGPHKTATSTVPIESKYTGNLSSKTICPTAILMAIATGMSTHVMVLKLLPIFSQDVRFWLGVAVCCMVPPFQNGFSQWPPFESSDSQLHVVYEL